MVENSGSSATTWSRKTAKSRTPFSKFEYAISSVQTKEYYHRNLEKFLMFLDINSSEDLELGVNLLYDLIKKEGTEWFSDCLEDYISFLKNKVNSKQISAGTLRNYYKPVKLFCDMNDILLNWKRISRGIPSTRTSGIDRAPTISEIHKILEYADARIRPLVLLMVSSGIRLGAWTFLKWKHIIPLYNPHDDHDSLISAKVIVYAGEPEQYFTFCTPEAYLALKDWMDYRSSYGEKITGESWLMRNKWQTTHVVGGRYGMASAPTQLSSDSIQSLLHDLYLKAGIRIPLEKGQRNHEFKTVHGFRKFYKTVCESSGMKPANVELLIGHDIGISSSYYKPTESQLLEDYLKVVNLLTMDKAFKLQEKLIEVRKENDLYRKQLEDFKELQIRVTQELKEIQSARNSKPNNQAQ